MCGVGDNIVISDERAAIVLLLYYNCGYKKIDLHDLFKVSVHVCESFSFCICIKVRVTTLVTDGRKGGASARRFTEWDTCKGTVLRM